MNSVEVVKILLVSVLLVEGKIEVKLHQNVNAYPVSLIVEVVAESARPVHLFIVMNVMLLSVFLAMMKIIDQDLYVHVCKDFMKFQENQSVNHVLFHVKLVVIKTNVFNVCKVFQKELLTKIVVAHLGIMIKVQLNVSKIIVKNLAVIFAINKESVYDAKTQIYTQNLVKKENSYVTTSLLMKIVAIVTKMEDNVLSAKIEKKIQIHHFVKKIIYVLIRTAKNAMFLGYAYLVLILKFRLLVNVKGITKFSTNQKASVSAKLAILLII